MKIMKRISLSIALIMASLFSLSAQDADYKSMTLTFAELKEVFLLLVFVNISLVAAVVVVVVGVV